MPTPVSAARQCLTSEAARALDDAVAVASRRNHTQTTSLHAVSALLALPSSALRGACSRAIGGGYPTRLQFRALDLSVGVSLDRLPSSKTTAGEAPPVSNSLMAAIKRSQANQRRHPDSFTLYQQVQNQNPSSIVKVELKNFILSILDDPIVSRVFGEAGFRSSDIKMAILRPPRVSECYSSKFPPPPLFLCNLSDWESNCSRLFENGEDENNRRIKEVLVKKEAKNPLLIGACSIDALSNFTLCVQRGKYRVLENLIDGLSVISVEKEIIEFLSEEGGSEATMELKFKELIDMVELCNGAGVIVNYGDLKVFVNGGLGDSVRYVVDKLSNLVEIYGEKLWLIGAACDCETYKEFVAKFSSVEKDWDLHILPITSSRSSNGGSYSKTSLMGSFVPFAGFFPTPSEFESLSSTINHPLTRCKLCNEKYEQEVSLVLKGGGSTNSVSDQYSPTLPSWLQRGESDTAQRVNAVEAKDGSVLKGRLMGLQRKWNNICQRLHHTCSFQQKVPQVRSQVSGFDGFNRNTDKNETNCRQDSLLTETRCTNLSSPTNLQNISSPRKNIPTLVSIEAENARFQQNLCVDDSSSSSTTSVTTDLGLGTLYAFSKKGPNKPVFENHKENLQNFSGSISTEVSRIVKNASNHITRFSPRSGPYFGGQFDEKDFKNLSRVLVEKVGYQVEAICTISQAISRCRSGNGRHRGSSHRGDVWLGFLGPDKVGKKRIAAALAEILFGSRENLISVDLSSEEDNFGRSTTVFDHQALKGYNVKFRGKTVVDYIAEELSREPRSVVFLENLDKADFLAQHSLSRAIRTGKFPDSCGREISINNTIFVTTSSIMKVNQDFLSGKQPSPEFSEERILGAKRSQIQILVETSAGAMTRINGSNVFLSTKKRNSNTLSVNKRKLIDTGDSTEQDETLETPKRVCLDLNLPVEEIEEGNEYGNCDSDSGSENQGLWLEDFFDQMDEKVGLESFDFHALAKKIMKEIGLVFQEMVGINVWLEIDEEVMVQMLAAAWLSEEKGGIEDWIQKVLCKSFVELHQEHRLTARSVVRLVAFEGLLGEDDEVLPHVCLPARIILR
ncbi:hypothetical protein LguiA_011969 [Lonicera macranthoides]